MFVKILCLVGTAIQECIKAHVNGGQRASRMVNYNRNGLGSAFEIAVIIILVAIITRAIEGQ